MFRIDPELLQRMDAIQVHGDVASLRLDHVTADSRAVHPGSVWVAMSGTKVDSHGFMGAAVSAGAALIVCERAPDSTSAEALPPFVVVRDGRQAIAELAAAAAGNPTRKMSLSAVLGTDGKTSTAMIIEAGLSGCGLPAGLLGTVVYRYPGRVLESSLTTPDPVTLQQFFAEMLATGVADAVMEVSSHAVHQRRVESCLFDCAVFTNLTRDHLDYHGSVEAYREAKVRFFTEVLPRNPAARGVVVNDDDPVSDEIRSRCPVKVIGWTLVGNPRSEIRLVRLSSSTDGTSFAFDTPWGLIEVSTVLIGRHNVANIMAAVGVAGLRGLSLDRFVAGIESMKVIPGRLERVASSNPVKVFVDYAHTPKAIESVLQILRPLVGAGRLHIVFGAGGDRDQGKRPLMGRAAVVNADHAVVCSDNPRGEDPMAIIDAIVGGIREAESEGVARGTWEIVEDRRAAINRAIRNARPGDVVLLAGKGHEVEQKFRDHTIRFSDVEVAGETLGK